MQHREPAIARAKTNHVLSSNHGHLRLPRFVRLAGVLEDFSGRCHREIEGGFSEHGWRDGGVHGVERVEVRERANRDVFGEERRTQSRSGDDLYFGWSFLWGELHVNVTHSWEARRDVGADSAVSFVFRRVGVVRRNLVPVLFERGE